MAKAQNAIVIGLLAVLVIAVLGYIGALSGLGIKFGQQASISTTGVAPAPVQQVTTTVPGVAVSCPSTGVTSLQVRYQDTAASSLTYANNVESYAVPKSPGEIRVAAGNTSGTSGAYSSAVNLNCRTNDPTYWDSVAVTQTAQAAGSGFSSAVYEKNSFVAAGNFVKVDLKGKASDQVQVRVKDKVADLYLNNSNFSTTAYVGLDGNNLIWTDQQAQTSMTVGADGYIDLTFYVKSNSTNTQYGEEGLRTFLCADADTSDWQEPLVTANGVTLKDSKNTLSADDKTVMSNYEYCYNIGSVPDTERQIGIYVKAKSGVNPDMDPIFRFIAEGRYNSADEKDAIKVGAFRDDSSNTEVVTSAAQQVTINIA